MSKVLAKLTVTKDTGELYANCKWVKEYINKKGHLTRSDVMIIKSNMENEMMIAFPISLKLYPFIVNKDIARSFTDILIKDKDNDSFEIDIISKAKH